MPPAGAECGHPLAMSFHTCGRLLPLPLTQHPPAMESSFLFFPPPYFRLGTLSPGAWLVLFPPPSDNQFSGDRLPLLGTEACVCFWNSWLQGPEGLLDS